MEKNIEDFISNWKINIAEKSARHESGLKIGYDSTNDDGSLCLFYSGMATFSKNIYAQTQDMEAIDEKRNELTQEFLKIYKQKMMQQNVSVNELVKRHESSVLR